VVQAFDEMKINSSNQDIQDIQDIQEEPVLPKCVLSDAFTKNVIQKNVIQKNVIQKNAQLKNNCIDFTFFYFLSTIMGIGNAKWCKTI